MYADGRRAARAALSNKLRGALQLAEEGDGDGGGARDFSAGSAADSDGQVRGGRADAGRPAPPSLSSSSGLSVGAPHTGAGAAAPPPSAPLVASSVRAREHRAGGVQRIGHIEVCTDAVLGYGSAGTMVFEGTLNGRPVAVKRLLRRLHSLAHKEIAALYMSDEHPNIVRCHSLEEDEEFIYLALERCRRPLSDISTDQALAAEVGLRDGQPSERALALARDICEGVAALHARHFVHRDLKPHNVLIADAGGAKVSDMGLSKKLVDGESSFESRGGPGGSSGWQAPEQLVSRSGGGGKQGRSMDIFSCGLVIFYVLTGGDHAFGAHYQRDANILAGRPLLAALATCPAAANLLAAMLQQAPKRRPPIGAVLAHPLWWSAALQLAFLVEVSDRMETEDREDDRSLLNALESLAPFALGGGHGGNWLAALDPMLLVNRYRRYNGASLRDLLRVIRNKHNHFRELPPALQARLSPLPGGFLRYFTDRFPQLLMAVFSFVALHCSHEEQWRKYMGGGGGAVAAYPFAQLFLEDPATAKADIRPYVAAARELREHGSPPREGRGNGALCDRDGDGDRGGVQFAADAQTPRQPQEDSHAHDAGALPPAAAALSQQLGGLSRSAQRYLLAPGARTCMPPLATGIDPELGPFVTVAFPAQPGEPLCEYYAKTGHCKYGMQCRFDHPERCAVRLSAHMLPMRPGQTPCAFFGRFGVCKFGAACKFHHPNLPSNYKFETPTQRVLDGLDDQWIALG